MSHAHVRSLVHRAVKNTPSLSCTSSQSLRKFCIDIALVTVGFRTGYLLDLFSISETVARDFGATLRKDSVFKDVLLLFHTDLEQVFFVNVSLLHDRHMEARSVTPWTSFIYLNPDPQNAPPNTPTEIHDVCQTILSDEMDQLSAFHACISSLSPPQMIAFAGYLLEYPVSYYPVASNQDSFLRDIPLEVYECTLIPDGFRLPRHSFMKFSRPGGCQSSPRTLVDMIERRFESRLGQLHTEWRNVEVICDTRTLDRVTL